MYTDTNPTQISNYLSFYLIKDLTNLCLQYFSFVKSLTNIKPKKYNKFKEHTFQKLHLLLTSKLKSRTSYFCINPKIQVYFFDSDNKIEEKFLENKERNSRVDISYYKSEEFKIDDILYFYKNIDQIYYILYKDYNLLDSYVEYILIGKTDNFYFYYNFYIPVIETLDDKESHSIKVSYNLNNLINGLILGCDKDKFEKLQAKINEKI